MTDRMWEVTTTHAKTCAVPDDKVYVYAGAHGTVYVDPVFTVVRVVIAGVEWPLQQLNRAQTVSPDHLASASSARAWRQSSIDFLPSLTFTCPGPSGR